MITIEHARNAAKRVHKEIDYAIRAWAVFEARNGALPARREILRSHVGKFDIYQSIKLIEFSIVQTVTMVLCRTSDISRGKNTDRLSLDVVAQAIREDAIVNTCIAEAREWHPPELELAEYSEQLVRQSFWRLRDLTSESADAEGRLVLRDVRTELKGVRINVLAHTIDGEWEKPTLRTIRRYLILMASLSHDANRGFRGQPYNYRHVFKISMMKANNFWSLVEGGIVHALDLTEFE